MLRARLLARLAIGLAVHASISAAQESQSTAPPITLDTQLIPPVSVTGAPAELLPQPQTLRERMAEADVPGLSIAVVIDGQIAWAQGFGLANVERQSPVTETTLFQAASISKPVAAVGALRLAELGVIDLDANVDSILTSWTIPAHTIEGEWDQQADPVTIRNLLSHDAGTTVRGFPGYERDQRIPTTVEVLEGQGNTAPVLVEARPNSRHQYSGGGYTIAQLTMVDAANEFDDFPSLMSALVLNPLGMNDSTFVQPLPNTLYDRASTGYQFDGSPINGNWVVHPEMAAAGLWTTPSDLARLFISLQQGMAGQDGPVLAADSVAQMLRFEGDVRYGLGINVGTERIGHGGGNRGFRCVATFFNDRPEGIVIMSNGDNGWGLNSDVLRTIFVELEWPGLRPIEKSVTQLDLAQLARCAGRFALPDGTTFQVEIDESEVGLVVTLADDQTFRLLPESESVFFDPADGVPITFDLSAEGPATRAIWSELSASRVQ
ncbi:MAG: serine hydrolase domain-containing protein [Planctomycetota bacterium]